MSSDNDFVVVNRDDQVFVSMGETQTVVGCDTRREQVVCNDQERITEQVVEIHVVAIGEQGPPGVAGSVSKVVCTTTGVIAPPYVGSARRYFFEPRVFNTLTVGVSQSPIIDAEIVIKRNGVSAQSVVILAGEMIAQKSGVLSVEEGDYLTVDILGGAVADVVVEIY